MGLGLSVSPALQKGLKTVPPDWKKELGEGSDGEGSEAEELSVCWELLETMRPKPRGMRRVRKRQTFWNGPWAYNQPANVLRTETSWADNSFQGSVGRTSDAAEHLRGRTWHQVKALSSLPGGQGWGRAQAWGPP